MFDWNEEEEKSFYKNNIERIVKNLGIIEGAKEYIDKLHNDGHVIYVITGRDNGEYTDRECIIKIIYILKDPKYCKDNTCIFGFELITTNQM